MGLPERPEWDDRSESVFDLVMPFIIVKSKGGIYEDEDFTAGWQCGELWGRLESRRIAAATYLVYSKVIPQLDRIAMRFNYRFDVLHDDGEWAQVGVTRND